jgi:membrane fusion protein, multidrug efflux system
MRLALLLAASAMPFLAGCRKQNAFVPPPPSHVGVATPVMHAVSPYLEATGNTTAYNQVDLVARVEGFVQSIDYKDGARVEAGKPLFVIEPAPYQAKLQQAEAAYASAQAQYVQSQAEFERQSTLGRRDFASQSVVDQARATRDTNQANAASQQAGIVLAQINLGYTTVAAPFAGVVTEHLVSVGDLVGVSGPTKLATIIQLVPIYVTFTVSEQDVLRIRANLAHAGLTFADLGKIDVEVGLMTEQGYPHRGVLDYVAPEVDSATGTLTVRAVLENKQAPLLPGYFVRIRIPENYQSAQAMLVPDAALGTTQSGRYLLVVNKDDVIEQRGVQTGQAYGPLRVIDSGLHPDDRVVIAGLARAIPGQKVVPQPTPMPDLPPQ